MAKLRGSETFNTRIVKTDEYVLMAKTIVENGGTLQQAALEIEAIDDMLCLMEMRTIIGSQRRTKTGMLRKDSALSNLIDGRMDQLMQDLKQVNN